MGAPRTASLLVDVLLLVVALTGVYMLVMVFVDESKQLSGVGFAIPQAIAAVSAAACALLVAYLISNINQRRRKSRWQDMDDDNSLDG